MMGVETYRPFNPKFKVNHAYVFDKCGPGVQWDPAVEVKQLSSPGRKYGQKPAKAFSGYSVYKP